VVQAAAVAAAAAAAGKQHDELPRAVTHQQQSIV